MSNAAMIPDAKTVVPTAKTLSTKLEVVILPVSDVERSKRYYQGLGWRIDADFSRGEDFRLVQLTPPGSPCSVHFGRGVTTAAPGSSQGLILVVSDVVAARALLLERGADVSEVFHYAGIRGPRLPGPDPERASYGSWASFSDPDGNSWMLQEIRARLPGRGSSNFDVETLTELLKEAETAHGDHGASAPKHHWSAWYAAYIVARQDGEMGEAAARAAGASLREAR
jgi:catechol 2,3-dioxygenase-like lactoylglutathione lyase family enzyme